MDSGRTVAALGVIPLTLLNSGEAVTGWNEPQVSNARSRPPKTCKREKVLAGPLYWAGTPTPQPPPGTGWLLTLTLFPGEMPSVDKRYFTQEIVHQPPSWVAHSQRLPSKCGTKASLCLKVGQLHMAVYTPGISPITLDRREIALYLRPQSCSPAFPFLSLFHSLPF